MQVTIVNNIHGKNQGMYNFIKINGLWYINNLKL